MTGFLYSILAYAGFLAAFVYFALFTDGILVPKHVDSGLAGHAALALAVNTLLILGWGVQHSVMARQGFKNRLTRLVPAHLERSTFVLASTLTLAALMWLWQPMAGTLWHVESKAAAVVLWTLNGLGWVGVPVVSFLIDHFDLFGLKQSFMHWRRRSYDRTGFVMPSLYRHVRHPMMSAILVGLWATPHMTVSHLVLSLGMTAYVLVGVHFEERSLRRELGIDYARYQASTPKFIPGLSAQKPRPSVQGA